VTHSIVARDREAGHLGVAAQSRTFAVGSTACPGPSRGGPLEGRRLAALQAAFAPRPPADERAAGRAWPGAGRRDGRWRPLPCPTAATKPLRGTPAASAGRHNAPRRGGPGPGRSGPVRVL